MDSMYYLRGFIMSIYVLMYIVVLWGYCSLRAFRVIIADLKNSDASYLLTLFASVFISLFRPIAAVSAMEVLAERLKIIK